VTSRQRLELEGEQEFPVLPLPTPALGSRLWAPGSGPGSPRAEGPEPGALLHYPSVALFEDRAQACRPEFRLTTENAPAVAALCDWLEGLPLAIELAAARARVLTPQQMLERLTGVAGGARFELLVSRRRDVSARHQSLRAAVEWSYRLLAEGSGGRDLQQFFARLSIFRGGFTLEAAEAICSEVELPLPQYRWGGDLLQTAPPRVEAPSVVEYLEHLRECSLIVADESPDGERFRYRLLETLRELAAEQLSPSERERLARRHLYYFMPLAHENRHRVTEAQTAAQQLQRLQDVEGEYENLRAALGWGLEHEPAAALWLAAALAPYWLIRGQLTEALEFLPRAARFQSDPMTEMRAKALLNAGDMAMQLGDYEQALTWLEEAAALARRMAEPEMLALGQAYEEREVPDPDVNRLRQMGAAEYEAAACYNLGQLAMQKGDYERARALYQQSLDLRLGLWSEALTASPLAGLGQVALAQGDYETARRYCERSLALIRAGGYRRLEALRLRELGTIALCQRQHESAQGYLQESLATFQAYGDRLGTALTFRSLGDLAVARGESQSARSYYQESLSLLRQVGHRQGVAAILEGLARLAHANGRAERAVRLFGAARALRDALGSPLPPNSQPEQEALLAALRQSLGDADFGRAWETGRSLPLEQACAEALADA
jgi:predicted ATPase/predicted negative regulator of RcsB-dependent stress response